MPPFTTTDRMSTLPGIAHGFFGRRGGVSTGVYESLNLGQGSGDNARAIVANRKLVRDAVGAQHLQSCYQIHSDECVWIVAPLQKRPEADGMVTKEAGIALCVLAADCVPVLFADAKAGVIGACHAGWKGALGGICQATLSRLESAGANRADVVAAIGPSIHQASYEVGPEFRDTFLTKADGSERFFIPGHGDRFHFDLPGFVHAILVSEGVGAIDHLEHDTCAMDEEYFSNRRRNRRGEPDYGRNGSVIMLTGQG
ncbi:MAG: peptidoglycan editing factor PgeF [Pseudomonadota bacterium]